MRMINIPTLPSCEGVWFMVKGVVQPQGAWIASLVVFQGGSNRMTATASEEAIASKLLILVAHKLAWLLAGKMTTLQRKGSSIKEHLTKYGLVSAGSRTKDKSRKKGWFERFPTIWERPSTLGDNRDWKAAEVKYSMRKSTTNLINRVDNEERSGHRDRHNKLLFWIKFQYLYWI